MDEQNPNLKQSPTQSMRALSSAELEGHKIGEKLADEATFAEAGREGVTSQSLERVWRDSYTLGRNAVESALGASQPYASDRILEDNKKQE